jgi:hypothetical protein
VFLVGGSRRGLGVVSYPPGPAARPAPLSARLRCPRGQRPSRRCRHAAGSEARAASAARDVVGARRAEKHVVGVRRGQTTTRRSRFPAYRQQRLRARGEVRHRGGGGAATARVEARSRRAGNVRSRRYQRRSVRPRMKAAWPACSRSSVSTLIRRTAMVTGGSQCRSTIVSMSASVRPVTNSTVCSYVASW